MWESLAAFASTFLLNLWDLWSKTALWLVLGLVIAGVIKAYAPVARWLAALGSRGFWPTFGAALLGTPLPLCSCSVLPVALTLRRSGASQGTVASFLVATPENGPDSLAITYALLGPLMMLARPVAAISTAMATGLAIDFLPGTESQPATRKEEDLSPCCRNKEPSDGCGQEQSPSANEPSGDLVAGLRYAAVDVLDDLALWLAVGLVVAAGLQTALGQGVMESWGSGWPAKFAMLAVGVPIYVCATSSTPVAAGLFAAGISPGTVLVFLLAGPATNLGSVGALWKELGARATVLYLIGVAAGALLFGAGLDWAVIAFGWTIAAAEGGHAHEWLPLWLTIPPAVLLPLWMFRPLRSVVGGLMSAELPQTAEKAAK